MRMPIESVPRPEKNTSTTTNLDIFKYKKKGAKIWNQKKGLKKSNFFLVVRLLPPPLSGPTTKKNNFLWLRLVSLSIGLIVS